MSCQNPTFDKGITQFSGTKIITNKFYQILFKTYGLALAIYRHRKALLGKSKLEQIHNDYYNVPRTSQFANKSLILLRPLLGIVILQLTLATTNKYPHNSGNFVCAILSTKTSIIPKSSGNLCANYSQIWIPSRMHKCQTAYSSPNKRSFHIVTSEQYFIYE